MNNSSCKYTQVYAVLRVDGPVCSDAHVKEFELDGKMQPAAGPSNVAVKQIVMTAELARKEVMRLNRLSVDKKCEYYWQSTHLFLDGGSHGSQENETND